MTGSKPLLTAGVAALIGAALLARILPVQAQAQAEPPPAATIAGVWMGTAKDEAGNVQDIQLHLEQRGTEIAGTSRRQYVRMTIYFAIMEVRGSIAGGHAVTLEETTIVQQSPGSGWSLLKAMQLTLSGNTLAGKWEALNQESGGKIAAGEMTLKRSAE